MENLLRFKGLWNLVKKGFEEPETTTLQTIAQQAQMDEIKMKDYRSKFGGNERVKRSLLNTLRREFEVLEMKKEETIKDYFAKVLAVANQMRSNGEIMSDSMIVEKILRTLIERFTYVVVSIEEEKDTCTMSVDELQSSLSVHEEKFKRMEREEDHALKAVAGNERFDSKGHGVNSYRGCGRGRERSFDKAHVECYKCHKLGHFQYECPRWKSKANFMGLDEEEELLLMSCVKTHNSQQDGYGFLIRDARIICVGTRIGFLNLIKAFDTLSSLKMIQNDDVSEDVVVVPNIKEVVGEELPSLNIPAADQGRIRRENRRAPEWQKDYVRSTGLGISDEDEEVVVSKK
ncbi:uncharacterized protein LOC128041024 [Gossypium raimondii]|uniref:uncharacterized protein LOC128041024 n=1 Tax=Gossypium raimondii TaxID=29730 RepID=UPI00227C7DBA|nr:uncharacterized protein LOC128041024 [Gossypium raimondii]